MKVSEVEQEILNRVIEGVHQRLGRINLEETQRIDPAWVAAAMLNAIPTEHPFAALGPFYDTSGLVRWLGITRQALHQKVTNHQMLAPATGDGQRVYPAWQFTPDGRLVPGLTAVLRVLLAATDPWTAAVWLTTPSERLGEKSAVEHLRATGPVPAHHESLTFILAAAQDDAARWAR